MGRGGDSNASTSSNYTSTANNFGSVSQGNLDLSNLFGGTNINLGTQNTYSDFNYGDSKIGGTTSTNDFTSSNESSATGGTAGGGGGFGLDVGASVGVGIGGGSGSGGQVDKTTGGGMEGLGGSGGYIPTSSGSNSSLLLAGGLGISAVLAALLMNGKKKKGK